MKVEPMTMSVNVELPAVLGTVKTKVAAFDRPLPGFRTDPAAAVSETRTRQLSAWARLLVGGEPNFGPAGQVEPANAPWWSGLGYEARRCACSGVWKADLWAGRLHFVARSVARSRDLDRPQVQNGSA